MCGITGYFSYKNQVDTKKYYEAHKKIAHRGPDDEGFLYKNDNNCLEYLKGNDTIDEYQNREHIANKSPSSLILGHRRLSIIDLTAQGHQPFVFEHLSLVYNGEIYNYIELRDELIELGYKFTTNSDTEVFLKAYHCWGVNAFNKFNGMWASAIYDEEKDETLLVRDRFGIKPLYYSFIDDNLIFGSEIKFITSFFDKLDTNEQAVYDYLRFNYINHNEKTFFKNICQIEPNIYLIYSKNGLKKYSYWDVEDKIENISMDNISNRLEKSIQLRMRSDVEVGSLLSGGIDSSTILGMINHKGYVSKFQTFSAVFKEDKFSEKKFIKKFETNNIDLQKHYIYPDATKLEEIIGELLYTQEEPFRSLAVYSQYEIYKYIHVNTNVKVLLNGQGADEIFTGYTEYYYVYLIELFLSLKFLSFKKEFVAFSKNRNIKYTLLLKQLLVNFISTYIRKKDKYRIFKKDFKITKKRKKFKSSLKNSLWNSLTFSALREYLMYEDKNSMRFSLESRLPFLDFKLVEEAFLLDNSNKIKNGISKVVLRGIAKDKIPNETLNRKDKMGFVSPQEIWQKTILKKSFDEVFKDIEVNGLFDFLDNKQIYRVYTEYKEGELDDWSFIWRIYCLYQWKKVWRV